MIKHTNNSRQDHISTGNFNEICTPPAQNETAASCVGTTDKLSNNFGNFDLFVTDGTTIRYKGILLDSAKFSENEEELKKLIHKNF